MDPYDDVRSIFWWKERISPREGSEPNNAAGTSTHLINWSDLERSGAIWSDLERYGAIWSDLDIIILARCYVEYVRGDNTFGGSGSAAYAPRSSWLAARPMSR